MIIGTVGLAAATRLLSKASRRIGRQVRPHILDEKAFLEKKTNGDPFIARVLEGPRLFIVGAEEDLEAIARA